MKKNYSLVLIAFLCTVLSGYGQVIVKNSFEETAADTWTPLTFSTAPCSTVDTWDYSTSLSSITPSDGAQFWGVNDLNGTCGSAGFETITFPSYNVSSYTGVTISFDYYIIGFDNGDDLGYEIWEDGSMVINVDNLAGSTGGWTTFTHNVNAATTNVYLVLKVRQNGNGDYAAFDNVLLEGASVSGNNITVTQATGGTITPGTTNVADNANQSFTATPDACHTFTNWIVDGSSAGSTNPYTFTNVTADHTITAVYTADTYAITASTGANGSISPNGVTNVTCGTDQTYTITPNGGYAVQDVLVDGLSVGAVTSYDFTNVTATHTISVIFEVFVGPCLSDNFNSGYGNWTGGSGTYNNGTAGNTGNGIGFNTNNDDIITSTALSNPSSISFIARASGTTSNFTINIQYSTTSTGPWTNATSIVANGSNSGDITSTYNTFNLALGLTGNYYLRIIQTPRSGGSFYLDDVDVYCIASTPEPEINLTQSATSYTTTTISAGSDTYDFGAHETGTNTDIIFTIENTGNADLTLSAPVVSGTGFNLQAGLSATTVTGPSGTATFTVRFSPTNVLPYSGTISIANNDADEDPYVINITGNGTNSNTSDIIASASFTYNSNIDYTAYQVATITNTGQSIDVFRFDIRDGGASNDSDALSTELTDITFNVANIANIRSAALFNGNALVANNPVITGSTISFSGLSYAAPDNGSASLSLRVTFLTTVTDNDQLQFTISSATANTSGSQFGTANAGGATSSTTGNRNRIEVTADRLNFLQQPSTTSTNAIMTPAVQVEATDINGNRDLDWSGNISITSDGTMTGDPISAASANSISTFNSITHTASGTGLTLTASATGLLNDASSLFDIILFTFSAGDFRPKYATDFSFNGDWEYFNGSAWVNVPDGNAPQNTSTTITRILIDKYVTGGGSATNSYDCDILILSGGTLELLENDSPPIANEFLSAGNTLEVRDSGQLIIRGDIDIASSTNLIVRSGGYMAIDQNTMTNVHPIWDGVEMFEGGSMVEINDWDWGASATERSLINVANAITNNASGYKFGNLYFNPTNLSNEWTVVGSGLNINITENDFEINNNSSFYVLGMSNRTANISSTYGGNIIVTDGPFTFGGSFSNDTFDQNFLILGNVVVNSNDDFFVHHTFNGTPTIIAGNSPVIIEGNLEVNSTVNTVDSDVTTKEILFSGNTNHTIEVAPNCSNVPFVIESGDTATLLNEHLKFTGDSSLEVESGATFDFSFNGATALEVQDISGARNMFITRANSTLYITHPQGIWDSSTQGNVEDFSATNTTYNQTATFYYVGKQNQVTGDAITIGSTVKNVYVILDTNNLELRLTNRTGISDGGKLEIQQGIVIGEEAGVNDNDFYGPDGQLIMTGGEYRISTITANQLTDYLPQLRKYSSYSLTGGIIHLNGSGTDNTQILSGVPNYVNLSFSGSNVLEGLPPLPPGLPTYKGISNGTDVSGTITISEDAIVDIKNSTLGGSTTNLVMENQGRFIMAGSGTKPDARGTYTLDPNTTIEFNNNGGFESVRLTNPVPSYANIVVSGSNVGTITDGSGPNSFIQFQPNGSFTITGAGTFKHSNSLGFSGLGNTAISNTNTPTIELLNNSTVEYAGANQIITPFTTTEYKNVTLSGSGIKSLGHPTDILVGEDLNIVSATLNIDTGEVITVDEGVIVTGGNMNIEDSGSLVQINETDTNSGNISMKRNSFIKIYDYVYWSSPVSNFNTNGLFQNTSGDIYYWDPIVSNVPFGGTGQGYWLDAANQSMTIGQGYIARAPNYSAVTLDETLFNNGVPNNGTITLNLARGNDNDGMDGDDDDDDWNLVGNPYPSSISAMAFLTSTINNNTSIDGFINLWTHGIPPLASEPDPFYEDNNGFNYDPDDYITANGTATTCSPNDNTVCFDGFIAAGQGFMVNTMDGLQSTTIPISFTNAMRSRNYDNSNFFRVSNTSDNQDTTTEEKHRVWLDLASENNGVDRLVIGYVTNATAQRDRLYDAISSNKDGVQNFYSIIEDKPFVIQGRGLPFVDTDVIPLGFNSAVGDNFTIAINAVDGLFQNQTVYLKDNLIGFVHDLTNAPYTFTSEIGEFNDRFEIVFQPEALSVSENELSPNDLTIVELGNGDVKFSVGKNSIINAVEILDVLGRTIYKLRGQNSTETYNLSNLSQATYIARVTLSNGQTITKKAVKMN